MRRLFERFPAVSVLILMFLCLTPFMALRDVTPSNELRYLSIAEEAIRDGHVFVFTNHGVPYADKPPLYFWLLMLFKSLLGRHSIYLLSMLSFLPAAVVTLVMDRWVYAASGKHPPAERASMALLLCSTVYWLALGIFLRMDMLMVMFIVLALYSWHRNRPWLFALYSFLALFTKGPVGILMPPVTLLCYALSCRGRDGKQIWARPGRFLGWRFLLLVGGLCAIWFTAVRLEGGREYLHNLLFHQTVDRTINAFHHKRPLWFYLVRIWPIVLPWGLLTIPVCVASLARRGTSASPVTEDERSEKLFRCAFFSTFIMLSCSSSKLPVYLLPVFPFVTYLLPLYARRRSWKTWMNGLLAAAAGFTVLPGCAATAAPLLSRRVSVLSQYEFASSPLITAAGLIVLAGCLGTFYLLFRKKRQICSAGPLAVSILLFFLITAALVPKANAYLGFGAICSEIRNDERVYTLDVKRSANMDVYLGREVTVLGNGEQIPDDGAIITDASFASPLLDGRESLTRGGYTLWRKHSGLKTE